MPTKQLISSIRDSDLSKFVSHVSDLPMDVLTALNNIHYTNWFPGLGFTLMQLTSMVRPGFADHLINKGLEVDLHSACVLGKTNIIKKLLDDDPSKLNNSIAGFLPIQFASKQPESIKMLLKYGEDPDRQFTKLAWFDWESKAAEKGYSSFTAMHNVAVGRGGIQSANYLKNHDVNLNITSQPFGEKPIHLAAIYNKSEIIKWLVENGVAVDTETNKRHEEFLVGELFDESYFSPFENSFRKTPLMLAAGEGQTKAVKQLLDLNANPNAIDSEGYSPLHYACGAFWKANIEIAKLLLQAGANSKLKSQDGTLPSQLANTKKYTSIVEMFS